MPAIPLPNPPPAVDWSKATADQWGTLGNESAPNSTIAAACHLMKCWSANAFGAAWQFDDADTLDDYKKFKGPGGTANLSNVLDQWKEIGIRRRQGGNSMRTRIDAFAELNVNNRAALTKQVQQAIQLFGGCYIGLNLPKYAVVYDDEGAPKPEGKLPPDWNLTTQQLDAKGGDADADGNANHCVAAVGYAAAGLQVVTWGARTTMSWDFFYRYYQEVWAVMCLSAWINGNQSPSGQSPVALKALFAALKEAGQG